MKKFNSKLFIESRYLTEKIEDTAFGLWLNSLTTLIGLKSFLSYGKETIDKYEHLSKAGCEQLKSEKEQFRCLAYFIKKEHSDKFYTLYRLEKKLSKKYEKYSQDFGDDNDEVKNYHRQWIKVKKMQEKNSEDFVMKLKQLKQLKNIKVKRRKKDGE